MYKYFQLCVYTNTLLHNPSLQMSIYVQLVNSELVAKNCKCRCEELGIPYYRLSPKLDEVCQICTFPKHRTWEYVYIYIFRLYIVTDTHRLKLLYSYGYYYYNNKPRPQALLCARVIIASDHLQTHHAQ